MYILVPPQITRAPTDVTANIGQFLVRFVCEASGVPNPTISWRKGSNVVQAGGRVTLSGNQLLINDVDTIDSGTYTCVASNPAGSDTASAELNVIGKDTSAHFCFLSFVFLQEL